MTASQLNTLLKSTGYPVAYNQFKSPPTIPFIVYMIDPESHRGADGKNNIIERGYRVELYTEKKDLQAESKLGQVLNFTQFEKTETFIKEENLYQNAYDFSLTLKEA